MDNVKCVVVVVVPMRNVKLVYTHLVSHHVSSERTHTERERMTKEKRIKYHAYNQLLHMYLYTRRLR